MAINRTLLVRFFRWLQLVQDALVPAVVGVLLLAIAAGAVHRGDVGTEKAYGFLCGLAGGWLSAALVASRRPGREMKRALHVAAIFVSPFGALGILFLDVRLATGYFVGAAVAFCFVNAVVKSLTPR